MIKCTSPKCYGAMDTDIEQRCYACGGEMNLVDLSACGDYIADGTQYRVTPSLTSENGLRVEYLHYPPRGPLPTTRINGIWLDAPALPEGATRAA